MTPTEIIEADSKTAEMLQHTAQSSIDGLADLKAENALWAIYRQLERQLSNLAKKGGFK